MLLLPLLGLITVPVSVAAENLGVRRSRLLADLLKEVKVDQVKLECSWSDD